jgi:hypothetical protein
MSGVGRAVLLGAVLAVALATPAGAAEVLVVDGAHASKRDDPLVPSPSATDLGRPPLASASRVHVSSTVRGRRAVAAGLRRAYRARRLSRAGYRRYLRGYRRALSTRRRLRGARGAQLGYLIASLEGMALRGRLTPSRMPVLFLQLERNRQYWPRLPYPGSGTDVTFRGSEILFRFFPGRGLQLHPLATFKKANAMYGACRGAVGAPCRRAGLARLLDEMSRLAVRRGRGFVAWEYLFHFGGGSPPWMSGMAQATGIQALGRAAELLGRPSYVEMGRKALGAFSTGPSVGVRTRGFAGGTHYLQYSFAPRLYIYNAFVQSLIGLYDFSRSAGDARARALYDAAEPEARREIPTSDVGDWSRYSYRGRESNRDYHELLRELLQSMCTRRLGSDYCTYARRYQAYQTQPPTLTLAGPARAAAGEATAIVFELSKLSAVEVTVTRGGRTALHRIATFRRGRRSFSWRPGSPGTYSVRLGAKELRTGRGLRARDSGTIEVE